MHGVSAIGQLFGFCVAFFVADKGVTDAFVCVVITSCTFEKELKRGSFFGRFDFRLPLIRMLNDFNIALDNVLVYAENAFVVFDCVLLGFCADRIDGLIELITLGRLNLSDSPIIAANIFLSGEFTVLIGDVGINQLIAVIDAVLCTGKGSVALRLLCF